MQSLPEELWIIIFKLILSPLSLALANRKWFAISQNPQARAEWIIYHFGRSHAFFHAIRLDNFLTLEVVQALLARNATISRYFIQRLMTNFGTYDQKLIEIKSEYSMNQSDFIRNRERKSRAPWASKLPLPIFTNIITEASNMFQDLAIKGNDMELFHYYSAGPLVINYAPQKLFQNINLIEDLILNKKFIPFPPRPKITQEDITEGYSPNNDGYEDDQQLNVIARAIIIHPDLVNMWKNIGYYEICSDVNELVIQGALLILFPPTPPSNWESPDVNTVAIRLRKFTDLGFQLTNTVMNDIFRLFELRLNEIGDLLINSFQLIRKEPRSIIISSCINNLSNTERDRNILRFLNGRIFN